MGCMHNSIIDGVYDFRLVGITGGERIVITNLSVINMPIIFIFCLTVELEQVGSEAADKQK